jgi:cholesterol transport system auxiliary component
MLRIGVLLLALAGCAFNNPPLGPAFFYDLGLPAPSGNPSRAIDELLLVESVGAPSWLDSEAIIYRLAYSQDAKHHAYANSYWVGAPSDLLTARLTTRLADATSIVRPGQGLRADYALRVELLEFVQVFDSPDTSRGLVRLRASLVNSQDLLAQKSFSVAAPASSPDASGAVQALSEASDIAISKIIDWVADTLETQD